MCIIVGYIWYFELNILQFGNTSLRNKLALLLIRNKKVYTTKHASLTGQIVPLSLESNFQKNFYFSSFKLNSVAKGQRQTRQRHDIRHNDTQHIDTQHNDTQHNDTQHNDTQPNDTQHKRVCLWH